MNATRNRIAHGMIWALGAVLGAISSIVLLIAAAVPAALGLGAVFLAQIRALLRRLGRADA